MTAEIIFDDGVNPPTTTPLQVLTGVAVALSNQSNVGVLGWDWTLLDRPTGSVATVSTPALATSSITPDVPGTYLIRLQTWANAAKTILDDQTTGATYVRYVPVPTWRIPAAGETTEVDAVRGWAQEVNDILIYIQANIGLGSVAPDYVVFRPGGVPSASVVTTWNDLINALIAANAAATSGRFTVYWDADNPVLPSSNPNTQIDFPNLEIAFVGVPQATGRANFALNGFTFTAKGFVFQDIEITNDGSAFTNGALFTFPPTTLAPPRDGQIVATNSDFTGAGPTYVVFGGAPFTFGDPYTGLALTIDSYGSFFAANAIASLGTAFNPDSTLHAHLYDGTEIVPTAVSGGFGSGFATQTSEWLGTNYPSGNDGVAAGFTPTRSASLKYVPAFQIYNNGLTATNTTVGPPPNPAAFIERIWLQAGFQFDPGCIARLTTNNVGEAGRLTIYSDADSVALAEFLIAVNTDTDVPISILSTANTTDAWVSLYLTVDNPGDTAHISGLVLFGTVADTDVYP